MARKCEICGKGPVKGNNVSDSKRRTNRDWKPNLQKVKAIVDGSKKRIKVCTKCIKSGRVTKAH